MGHYVVDQDLWIPATLTATAQLPRTSRNNRFVLILPRSRNGSKTWFKLRSSGSWHSGKRQSWRVADPYFDGNLRQVCCLLAEHCRTFSWSPWIVFSIGPRNYRKRFCAEVVPRWWVRMWIMRALVEMMASMTAASIPVAIMLRPCFRPRRRHHVLLDKNAKIYNELDWRTSKKLRTAVRNKNKTIAFLQH